MAERFEYKYKAPTIKEKNEIEQIRQRYLPTEDTFSELKKLDRRVQGIPLIGSLIIGIVGTLGFGTGLTCVLEWDLLGAGIGIMLPCFILAMLAYPFYLYLLRRLKKKYKDRILELSNRLLNEEN